MAQTEILAYGPPSAEVSLEHRATPADVAALVREDLLAHLQAVGLRCEDTMPPALDAKDLIRRHHATHRAEYRARELAFVTRYGRGLLQDFAAGEEVVPEAVEPVLCPVISETRDSALFRLATLLWSVPVSRGYGRRMRFLVRDAANGKVFGLFALTDPVFNLRARDSWIGWDVDDRRRRLVNLMDAHVVGAVPPYDRLLGGKVVAALMTAQEVCDAFAAKYGGSRGIISGEQKGAQLVLLTVTSALGRSSLYNRLRLAGACEFQRIGMTEGWGHFHVPDRLFKRMRDLLASEGHAYASGFSFGQGPNWRMRVVRVALQRVGLDPDLLRHGVSREVFAAPLANDWRDVLLGRSPVVGVQRPSAAAIGRMAVDRWLVGRAARRPDYKAWTPDQTWALLTEPQGAHLVSR